MTGTFDSTIRMTDGGQPPLTATPARIVGNRFSVMALLRLLLAVPSTCEISVYTPHRALVRQLFKGVADAGAHSFVWDGRDAEGLEAPEGEYVVRASVDGSMVVERPVNLVR